MPAEGTVESPREGVLGRSPRFNPVVSTENWGALQLAWILLGVTGSCQAVECVAGGLLLLTRNGSKKEGMKLQNA